ncbi:hypothetical protein SLEP1_g55384 [Rubroshorea leprosula]|uniref:Secreted protein n=1 Tax=Rubroshorea leprosula TaxID=152421 RepID=A0AAV5MHD3_9ROSI|nr:hypothetical protein SLEP1_g55384 [Rubroshorea leprosula]
MPWKTSEISLVFSFLSCSRTHLEPRNLPSPTGKAGSALLCFFTAGCSCLVGANWLVFCSVSFPLQIPPAFPNLLALVPCL